VNTRALYLRARHGAHAVTDLATGLGPEARALLTTRQRRDAWFPIAPMIEIDRAIFERFMRGDVLEMRRFGREIATFEISTVLKFLLKLTGNPALVLDRLPSTYPEYLSPFLTRHATSASPVHLELANGLVPYYLCDHGCPGWLEAALGMAGARNCEVHQASCVHRGDPACAWQIVWG